MFDKNKFAQILKNINETYNSQRDFSKKSEINRTYLSQYMNMKLDEPPKPKILKKLADSSNGITTYSELMETCGYINDDYFIKLYNLKDNFEETESYYLKKLTNYKMSSSDCKVYNDLIDIIDINKLANDSYIQIDNELNSYFSNMDYLNSKSKERIAGKIKLFIEYYKKTDEAYRKIGDLKYKNVKDNNTHNNNSNKISKYYGKLFNIPVLGKIAAGQPILAEEYLEGYLPVDPNIYGMTTTDDYFYLKVSGESMNLKVHNGDYALIHKQDYAENGDIIVAIINGFDEATLKRYKKLSDELVMLEPMSTYPMEPIVINLKETKFQIIGKAIGQFGKF